MRAVLTAVVFLFSFMGAQAGPKEDAYAVVERWGATLNAGQADALIALYAGDVSLWGTASPTLTTSKDAIQRYFTAVAAGGWQVKLGEHTAVVLADGTVVDAGQYEFSRTREGQTTNLPARYTFVLVKGANGWVIGHQHSSMLPRPQ